MQSLNSKTMNSGWKKLKKNRNENLMKFRKDLICCKNKYWLKGHKLQKAKVEAKELQEAQTDQVHALFGKVSKMLPFLKIQVQVKLKYF